MSTLSVSTTYLNGLAPTESQLDVTRDSLLDFFNTTKLEANNIAAASMLYTKLSKAVDDAEMKWGTDAEGRIKYNSSTDYLQMANTKAGGDIKFTTKITSTEATSLHLKDSDRTVRIGTGGLLRAGTGQGFASYDLMWLLARYRKPRLIYTSSTVVTAENNTGTADETIIVMRDRVLTVVDRTLSLAATANGYDAGHTGAAVSGLEDGLTIATNTWYYVYAVEVQYGDDNDGTKAILVASVTSPIQANVASNNAEFGIGKWVYMGVIRRGSSVTGSEDVIIPFFYDQYGRLDFIFSLESGLGGGIELVASSTNADSTYTITIGTGDTDIPAVASEATFLAYRATNSMTLRFETGADLDLIMCGTHGDNTSPGRSELTVPVLTGYKLHLDIAGSASAVKRIYLTGITDHFA